MQDLFHPIVMEWFLAHFAGPTEAQEKGWPAIAAGKHTLISAPTGSGKTLAAFLICIDRLFRAAISGSLAELSHVVYVSPLKALSNDIHRNLAVPLAEITALARKRGLQLPDIRVAVRTGDTPAHERRALARKPPHIWITTPESLYILLTSVSGRRGMAGVHTLILDEIHAIVDDKRGSHLSLSVERLCALVGTPVTRIGLSATQRPIEEVARFLVGCAGMDEQGNPDCAIIDAGHRRRMDLHLELPAIELGPIIRTELWGETVGRVAALAESHRTTLVFVNTRRVAERVAHLLGERMGEDKVATHHGSLSRKTRLNAEERLKKAEVKVCVATASLELGIDIGAVELVCQIGSPRSISVLLQRVGRSGHWLGGIPKGRLFPLTRDELIECAALVMALARGDLEVLEIPPWPLDIMAQQIVAACSAEAWRVMDLLTMIRRAYPYRHLPQGAFESILDMLADGVATRMGRSSAYLHYDRVHGVLRGRRNARISALTSGGAIPDNADFSVVVDPEGTYVGSVNEDFVVESMAGDIFLLGNTSWKIRRVERGTVRVEDAHGQAPLIPFWLGEAPSRTPELSRAVSDLRAEIDNRLHIPGSSSEWLRGALGLPDAAAGQIESYVAEGKRVLGTVPLRTRIVAERFFDESGGMQVILHSPHGGRINRAWGLALRKRFCRNFDFELQASATDEGINLSLGPQHSFPLEDVFQFLRSHGVEEVLKQAVLASPIFTARWRWILTRSLAMLRFSGGKKVPAQLQRMRADDLLAAIFPAQAGCQDNREGPDVVIPDHPLVFETLRDCLYEALDAAGLRSLLKSVENGEIEILARDTPMPSAFSHQILNAMPYAFLDDAPLEERRARAVLLRRALPGAAGDLGRLNQEAIHSAAEDAWPRVRDREELHDLLLGVVLFPESSFIRLPPEAAVWIRSLADTARAQQWQRNGKLFWAAAESRPLLEQIPGMLPGGAPAGSRAEPPLVSIVRGWVEISGPVCVTALSDELGFPPDEILASLTILEGEGLVLRGYFTEGICELEFCDRRILARIHRATVVQLRREIEPVPVAVYLDFLFAWQHVRPESRLQGRAGLFEVIDMLQGFETAAAAWESEILPCRVSDYQSEFLDSLCGSGDLVWGRWSRKETRAEVPARRPGLSRTATIGLGLREDISWLLDRREADEEALSVPSRAVLGFLRRRGASFFPEILAGTRHLPSEIEDGLWQLVAAGLVTADAFAALRSLVRGDAKRTDRAARRRRQPRQVREGRWSLLEPEAPLPENSTELTVRQLLRRYGVLCREAVAREFVPPWRELVNALRRMEAKGEIRGGRFISGLGGEQFALPEAVDGLRSARRNGPDDGYIRISACDPLNLAGILTPGPRVPAQFGNRVLFRGGVPLASAEGGELRLLTEDGERDRGLLAKILHLGIGSGSIH
jgi:ATP-dependent helicase Lhr and Lhr-like helicase